MTITEHDGIAILPKRCDKCNRLFWLEAYDTYYEMYGVSYCKMIMCKKCINKDKKRRKNEI
jgi:hypothetical protein